MDAFTLDAVRLSNDRSCVEIVDQTLLPGQTKILRLQTLEEIREAICTLRVRGAPAIGICAAYGIALSASRIEARTPDAFLADFLAQKERLATARPTAVNLRWALDQMERKLRDALPRGIDPAKEALFLAAVNIHGDTIAVCRLIGDAGLPLLKPNCGVLTHCNAGALAAAKYGTATAPLYRAFEQGRRDIRVFCDETRPLLQGARLTAFELNLAGLDTTLVCDNMASYLMSRREIDIVLVGCDRVARNGDTANKIGTSAVAILAKHYGIPFYVCAPASSIDMSISTGSEIPIEERDGSEITELWYKERMAPEGIKVRNPAFDVTPHELISGFLTEHGLLKPPYEEAFVRAGIGQ